MSRPFAADRHALRALTAALALAGAFTTLPALADATPQPLPFAQDWSNPSLITANDNWAGVPGIVGYRGDGLTGSTGVNPETLLSPGTLVVDVNANQTNPLSFTTGGVTEFALANPTIALAGSGTAAAPSIVLHLNTTGQSAVRVQYTLRDLEDGADNALQQVALQYRVGNSGNFINVPAGYVPDATAGASQPGLTTPVSVLLPAEAENQAEVQVRIITTNAVGNDEWVGVDDIAVTGSPIGGGGSVNAPIVSSCPANVSFDQGVGGSVLLSASDADSVVNGAAITRAAVAGISLGAFSAATVDGQSASVALQVASGLPVGSYPVEVTFTNNELQSVSCNVTVKVDGLVTIPQIQGSGELSPLEGQQVVTRGVVTRVNNNGFFLQDPVGDGDASTSDGVFVFTGTAPVAPVAVGNELRVSGTVTEFRTGTGAEAQARPVTELTRASVTLLSQGQTVSPTVITLPEMTEGELERFEGMLVTIASPLTVSQNFFQGRYGQVTLAAGGRLEKPTNRHPAGSPEALAMQDDNARRRIVLDDGSTAQNPNPTPFMGADNTLRAGDTVPGITGVIDYGLATNFTDGISDDKIHPTEPVVFSRDNPRPASPDAVGGNVRVGSFNVLNYFTTIDQSGAACYPSGTRSDCRGADSAAEFQRQRNKIVPAILGLGADLVGLMEIENNGNTAVQDLVNGLNAVAGAGTWATVPVPADGTGTDAIRVAMIYKPGRLSLVGTPRSDTNPVHNRPPLAQAFEAANGERFSLVVNHFKSKGSCPSSALDPDADQGDGQGCFNATRVEQAQALSAFVGQLQQVDPDVVVVGDLNAYGKEDPVLALTRNGFVDELARFNALSYSYVFDGESGYLDHALTTTSLSAQVTGSTHWRINADEPSVIDYNTEFKPTDYYTPTVYRSSDHDPVILGLSLVKRVQGTSGRDTLVGTAGDDHLSGGAGADILTGGAGADTFAYASLRDALDRITDFTPGTDRIDLSALLASIGYASVDPVADGVIRLVDIGTGLSLQIDTDGNAGPALARPLLTLNGLTAAQINAARDMRF